MTKLPRWPHLRFSLATWFVVWTISAIVIGSLAREVHRRQRQATAVAIICGAGGSVVPINDCGVRAAPSEPVTFVRFTSGKLPPGTLTECLAALPQVHDLELIPPLQLDRRDIRAIGRIRSLGRLSVTVTKGCDYSAILAGRTITSISIIDAGADALAWQSLGQACSCTNLSIQGTSIPLQHLPRIQAVRTLNIQSGVAIVGFDQFVKANPDIDRMNLEGTGVDDEAMHAVAMLPGLQELWMKNTSVTDVGLAKLANSRFLRKLTIEGTALDGTGFQRLIDLEPIREPLRSSV